MRPTNMWRVSKLVMTGQTVISMMTHTFLTLIWNTTQTWKSKVHFITTFLIDTQFNQEEFDFRSERKFRPELGRDIHGGM